MSGHAARSLPLGASLIQPGQAAGPAGRRAWAARALDPGDPWLQAFREAARRPQIGVEITCLQRWPGAPRHAAPIIDRYGRDVLTLIPWPRRGG